MVNPITVSSIDSSRLLKGALQPEIATELMGVRYGAPIGIAPIGMSGLIWPGSEQMLARTAAAHQIPYALSTVATATPEVVGPEAGGMGWFQLYPPREDDLRRDLLERAATAGFTTLIVTADVPAPSRN